MNRRELLKFTAAAFAAPTTLGSLVTPQGVSEPSDDRALWVDTLRRLANPVFGTLGE